MLIARDQWEIVRICGRISREDDLWRCWEKLTTEMDGNYGMIAEFLRWIGILLEKSYGGFREREANSGNGGDEIDGECGLCTSLSRA